jgi:hypothetical protein
MNDPIVPNQFLFPNGISGGATPVPTAQAVVEAKLLNMPFSNQEAVEWLQWAMREAFIEVVRSNEALILVLRSKTVTLNVLVEDPPFEAD